MVPIAPSKMTIRWDSKSFSACCVTSLTGG
jgi:hypothetical protein